MAVKFLRQIFGRLTEEEALTTSAGAGDAGKIVGLDDNGKLHPTLLPAGLGLDSAAIVASEALAANDLVNVWNDAGTPKVRKTDATAAGKEACGFVTQSYNSGASATVYFEGSIGGKSDLLPGSRQYLSMVPGQCASIPPANSPGSIVQCVGIAISSTTLTFEVGEPITLV